MRTYDIPPEYDALYVCGDIHGEFKTLLFELKRFQIENAVVVVAGDCGIGFEKSAYYEQLYQKLSKTLEKLNILLLLLWGNHDDPAYFDGQQIDYPQMKAIPDYSVIKFKEHNLLCIGGATSIDRESRKQEMWLDRVKGNRVKILYWENEDAVFNGALISEITSEVRIDTVITHTAPSFCYPTSKSGVGGWLLQDNALEQDLISEREVMDDIYNRLLADKHLIKNWFYGHFHASNTEYISGVKFALLNINELKELM